MLVRLALADYLCFGAPAELSLRAAPPAGPGTVALPDGGAVALPDGSRVYDRAVLVGPGGAGKSALLRALGYLRGLVLGGVRSGPPPRSPNRRIAKEPGSGTELSLEVLHDGALWRYSMTVGAALIERERLTTTPADGRERLVFERARQGGVLPAPVVRLGEAAAGERSQLELIAFGTRPEQPFLAEAILREARSVQPIATWLRDRLQLLRPEAKTVGLAARCAREPAFASFVAELLDQAGFGVHAVQTSRRSLPHDYFETEEEQREVLAALTGYADGFVQTQEGEIIAERDDKFVELFLVGLRFMVSGASGRAGEADDVPLTLGDLSDGALRLLHLAQVLYNKPPPGHAALPQVFFVDELDRSLHPRVARQLLAQFAQLSESAEPAAADPGGAQLIATTHDAALLTAVAPAEVRLLARATPGPDLAAPAPVRLGPPPADLGSEELARRFIAGTLTPADPAGKSC